MRSPWFARYRKVCGDKLREGDRVRRCPDCGEPYHDDPRFGRHCWQLQFAGGGICNLCRALVRDRLHQDVFRHLTCWNGWNGVAGKHYCPNTGIAYPGDD